MRYESLIFDIDGTLWDSRALVAEGYNRQLQAEGLEQFSITAEDLKPLFGKILPEIAAVLFKGIPEEKQVALIHRCAASQAQVFRDHPCDVGYPRVREVLEKLSDRYRLFIVSNSQKGYPELCMKKLGLTPYIEGHLCHGDTNTSKGQTILRLMETYHIESAAYIGDTQGDYEATLEAKVPFIWASYGFGTPEGWSIKIDSIADLLDL